MINYIWFIMIFLGLLVSVLSGNGETMSNDIISSIESTVTFVVGLTGLMCFWCGVMKIAEKSGFTEKLAKVMKPILKLIFKDAAKDGKGVRGYSNEYNSKYDGPWKCSNAFWNKGYGRNATLK